MKKTLALVCLFGTVIAFGFTSAIAQAKTISLTSGDGQSNEILTPLAQPFLVTITDSLGAPVSGVTVDFAIVGSPGGATGQGLSVASANTDASGQASTMLTLGDKVGTYSVTATSGGLVGSPLVFTATAIAGPPRRITMTSGDGQSGQVTTALANPFVVTVTDRGDNPVSGRFVTFAVASFPPGATGQGLNVSTVNTNASGQASGVLTLGNKQGTYEVTASSGSLNGSPVTFTSTGTPGPATQVRVETLADGSGTVVLPQSLVSGTSLNVYAITRDEYENFVANAAADAWAVVSPTGGVTGTDLVASGDMRSATFTGHLAGAGQIRATEGGLTRILSGTISVTGGTATRIRVETKADGTGKVVPDTTLPSGSALTVYAISRDALDNFVGNIPASWSLVSSTGGVVAGDLIPGGASAVFTGHVIGSTRIRATSGVLTPTNSGTIVVTFGPAAKVRVETKADGTGKVAPDTTLPSGSAMVVYSNSRDASDNFVANIAADSWSLIAKVPPTGGVVDGDLVASPDRRSAVFTGHVIGSAQIRAASGVLTPVPSGANSVVPGPAARVRVETAADGTGTVFPARTMASGEKDTAFAITRDASDNFVANNAADSWLLINKTGGVVDGDLVPSGDAKSAIFTAHATGTARIRTTSGALPVTNGATITVTVGNATKIRVETRADGTGIVVPDQTLLSSRSITVYAISRDTADNFVANVEPESWSLVNKTLGVADGDLVVSPDKKSAVFTGDVPGTGRIQATLTGHTPTTSGTITVALGTPARVRVETKLDGTGTIVPAQNVMASRSITVYAISRDSSDNFLSNIAASNWSMQNTTGGVANSNLTASPDSKSAIFTGGILGSGHIRAQAPSQTSVPSDVITVTLGTTAKVRVETKADGSGIIVPAQVLPSGDSIHVYAVTRDSADNFVANVAADAWSMPVRTGAVLLTDLAPLPDNRSAHFKAHGTGTAQIQAASGSLQVVPSGLLTVSVGAASRLVFNQQPSTVVSQAVMSPPVTVRIEDVNGNIVSGDSRTVTLSLVNNTTGATLGGNTDAASGGLARFNNLTVDKADSNYLLRASSTPALTADTSNVFIVLPGLHTGFTVEGEGGGAIPAQNAGVSFNVRISARDQAGNVARSFTGTVSLSANGGGILATGGGATLAFTNGVLAAHTVSFTNTGDFSLTVRNSAGFETGTSNTFRVAAGAPGQIVFVQQPTNSVAGAGIAPAMTVQLQDALGNIVNQANVQITMDILSGTGVLSGTKIRPTNTSGIATFANLSIDSAGTKQLRARSGVLTPAVSDSFVISAGPAARLAFSVDPGTGMAGVPLSVQPVVTLQDQFGNTVRGASETVTLAIQNNPGQGALGGTRTLPIDIATGQAAFTDISVNKAATGYTLTATGLGVSTTPGVVVSAPFDITSGTPARLSFAVQPSNTVAGAVMSPAVVVEVQDTYGNRVSINDTVVTLSMDSSGSLGGNVSRSTIAGAATFNDLRIDKQGTKVLHATGGGLSDAFSVPFAISPGSASKLAFTLQPGGGVAGEALSPQPVVTLQDAFGNTVTGTPQGVTISLKDTAGPGARLGGATTVLVDTDQGTATFENLSIDKSGIGYTLTAVGSTVDTASGVALSQPITIVSGAPKTVHVETRADGEGTSLSPQNVSSGVPISVYAVSRDALDNFVANVAAERWELVDMAGGAKENDLVPAADMKSAVFTGGSTGSSARIVAAAAGLTADTSGVLSVVQPGAPTKILVETAPNGTGTIVPAQTISSGEAITVYAVERDAANNFVANIPADSWSLEVASGDIAPSDIVPATDKKSAIFIARRVGKARIVAALGTLTQMTSDTIVVIAGAPARLGVASRSPDSARIDTYFGSRLVTVVRDSAGNPVRNVLVAYSVPSSGPSSLFDDGIQTATTDSLGLATSKPLKANTVVGQYADTARVAGIKEQAIFVLRNLAGVPNTVTAITGTPQTTERSTAFPIPLSVAVRDSFGNAADNVLVTFTAPPPTGASGTFVGGVNTAYTNAQGVATSAIFVANIYAGTYTVQAAVAGIATPASFTLTNSAGAAGSVTAKAGSPQSAQVTAPFATRFQAEVKDGAGNLVSNILVRFTAPATGASGTFPGGLTDTVRTNASGIATASIFTADSVAGTYNLIATVDGVSGSALFALTNLPAAVDTFIVESVSGGEIGTQTARVPFAIKVTAKDIYNNVATGFAGTVSISATGGGLISGGGRTASFVAGVLDSHAVRTTIAGTYVLTAVRTGGAESGKTNSFPVINPAPTVRSINPSSGVSGQTLNVTLLGGGFISGVTSVTFGDQITTSTVVTSDTVLTVTIRIDASAALGPRNVTVFNSPPGGSPPFTVVGGFTVGDIDTPTVTSITPSRARQQESVRVTLRGTNFNGGGVTQVSFLPPAGIAIDSVTVDSLTQMTMKLTISSSAAVGSRHVLVMNTPPGAADTLFSGFSIDPSNLAVPVLVSPLDGAQNLADTLTLAWQSAFGATGYDLQVSADSFSTVKVNEQVTATSRKLQASEITPRGKHYWRVRSRNNNGASAWASPWTFNNAPVYPAEYTLNDTVSFPYRENASEYTPQEYQLVGLPGDSKASLSAYIPGAAGTDWQAYWDNGGQSNHLVQFVEGDSRFTFAAGSGFWLIKRGPWIISNLVVPTASLQNSTASIHVKLHSGWNIISNPYDKLARWSVIQAANPLLGGGGGAPIWEYGTDISGTKLWKISSDAKPYTGYYLYNDPANPIDTLRIPFGSTTVSKALVDVAADSGSWQISVDLRVGKFADRSTFIGVSPQAVDGRDKFDYNKPRPFADVPGTYLNRPEWDSYYGSFASDIRSPFNKIGVWEFTVSSAGPKTGAADLEICGLENVPGEFGVYLVDMAAASFQDLRKEGGSYKFVPAAPKAQFKLMIGTKEALEQEISTVVPRAFALEQNYPNPFNPSTTIPVSVPHAAEVTLKIYNIIGEEVATVYSGLLEQGRHRFTWEGRNGAGIPVASGVYFVRLTTVSGPSFVGKMLLMK